MLAKYLRTKFLYYVTRVDSALLFFINLHVQNTLNLLLSVLGMLIIHRLIMVLIVVIFICRYILLTYQSSNICLFLFRFIGDLVYLLL